MKSFKNGTKVEILYSGNDNAPEWTAGTVVNVVRSAPGFERHGQFTGNVVKVGKQFVAVTEPGMIREAQ